MKNRQHYVGDLYSTIFSFIIIIIVLIYYILAYSTIDDKENTTKTNSLDKDQKYKIYII